jgi:DNA-binding MarR family transcriptional regulator
MKSQLPHLFLQVLRQIREQAQFESDPKLLMPPEFMALKYFEEHPSGTLSSFALFMHVRKPTATELLQRLFKREFLKRLQSEKDRRVFEVEITPEGIQALRDAEKAFEFYANGVFAVLNGEEQAELFKLLSKITNQKNG